MTYTGTTNHTSADQQKPTLPMYLLILILPFLLLYWIVPFLSGQTIGSDYIIAIQHQMDLLFSVKEGAFPLYEPGYAFGQSSIVMTWSQIFHPISHLASIMPGYWSGKAMYWNTFFKLLSLGITQLILFVFIRRLNLKTLFSFIISFLVIYNLRMLDQFRFGASLEAYTAHLVLCAAFGWYFIYPSRLLGPIGIIFSTYLTVVSGHPQFMYYGLLGSGLFLLVIPFFISDILPENRTDFKGALKFLGKSGAFMGIGIILSAIYIIPFYFDFLLTNTGRVGSPFEWSLGTENFFGLASNFFLPFLSDVHGAFGASSLILLVLLLPALRLFKVKVPSSVWAVWGIVLFILLYMLGERTPVYEWAWEYLPFISSFRNQTRIAMIMPVFLMLILVWLMKSEPVSFRLKGSSVKLTSYSILAGIAVILIPIYSVLFYTLRPSLGFLPPVRIYDIPQWIMALIVISGMTSLILLIIHDKLPRRSGVLGILLCISVLVQTEAMLHYGTFFRPIEDQPTLEQLKAQKQEDLDYRYHPVASMHSSTVTKQFKNSFNEPFLGKIYTQAIPVTSLDDAYTKMKHNRIPQQAFIEGYSTEKAVALTKAAKNMKAGTIELKYNSFNNMKFHVNSQAPALFGFSFPYTGHWRAWVDGEKSDIYRANGSAHVIDIPKGESLVEFRYWSDAFFWGIIISFFTFAMVGSFICLRLFNGLPKITGIFIVLLLSTALFIQWYNSLYSGKNIGTIYNWSYSQPLEVPNIAYGKKTSGFTIPSAVELNFHTSKAVDGETVTGSGFTIDPSDKVPLLIDLDQSQLIKTILVYGDINSIPVIAISDNGDEWEKTEHLSSISSDNTLLHIDLENPVSARFITIRAVHSRIGIDEVEVYGAPQL